MGPIDLGSIEHALMDSIFELKFGLQFKDWFLKLGEYVLQWGLPRFGRIWYRISATSFSHTLYLEPSVYSLVKSCSDQ